MYWAEAIGLAHIRDKVRAYYETHGEYWKPVALLDRAAEAGSWKAALEAGSSS